MRSTFRAWIGVCGIAFALSGGPALACVGDCNGDARVTIDELTLALTSILSGDPPTTCDAVDNDRDGAVTVNELVRAVTKALGSCGLGSAGESLLSAVEIPLLYEYDLGSGARTLLSQTARVLPQGQPCVLPGGPGNLVVGDRSGPDEEQDYFSIVSPDGTFLQSLPIPGVGDGERANVTGCAADGQGRLFGAARLLEGRAGGLLVVYFPPDYTTSCVIDEPSEQGYPGNIAADDAGDLVIPYVAVGESLPGRVLKFAPPFPANAGECASVHPTKSTFIQYDDATPSGGIARAADGRVFVALANLPGPRLSPGIREHSADGTLRREILPPGNGNPVSLALDATGALYYADQKLIRVGSGATSGEWTVRKVAFDTAGTPATPELIDAGGSFASGIAIVPSRADEWLTLGGSIRRTYFNPRERILNQDTVTQLIPKWKYLTSGMISAQAAVTWVDLPGEGRTQIVIASSWDGSVYALRTENGSRVWSYLRKPQPGTFYPFAGSPTIAWIDGQQRVYVPGGETMYCLDATTGAELWQFDAGTGCTDCTPRQERNQIESTAAVVNGLVLLGMDTNDSTPGKGGVFALRADDGRLVWFFDLMTSTTCRPFAEDNIRRFDAFHGEAELGLPEGFLASRPGCDFDRYQYACGNVWSSAAVDLRRGLFYIASSNCDTDDDPETAPLPPPMKPYDEAIFAMTLDGDPAWVWRPREVDNDDLSFGAVPNLFEAEIGGTTREVVGIGGKDGTYYVLDRDGVNEITGVIEPYWQTNVVPGGPIGGIIGAASVGDDQIVFASAFGVSISVPQKPAVHALDPSDGSILWDDSDVDTGYCPAMGVPGVSVVGGTPRPNLNFFNRDGELLRSVQAASVPSGIAAAPTILNGQIYVGAGTGAFNEGSDALREATRDTPLSAFCVQGTPGCATNTCDDSNVCTYDYRNRAGTCVSEPSADGLDCRVGTTAGRCGGGTCGIP